MARELILYCDESDISGKHFANFYGGLLVESSNLAEVERRICARCDKLNLRDEVKWQKISTAYAGKYMSLIDELFDLVAEGKVKIRIMFTQNYFSPLRLSADQREMGFFLLYYQFVKHGFGLQHAGVGDTSTRLRLLFDKLPDTEEKCARFKGFLAALTRSPGFRSARIELLPESISEIDSKQHILLQCVDIVLGAMQFRLKTSTRINRQAVVSGASALSPRSGFTSTSCRVSAQSIPTSISGSVQECEGRFQTVGPTRIGTGSSYRRTLWFALSTPNEKNPVSASRFPGPSQVELGRSRNTGS